MLCGVRRESNIVELFSKCDKRERSVLIRVGFVFPCGYINVPH